MSGPLASLKVLDFSTLLPGPFASLLLADMGAEVLRIESPTRMDLLRVLPPHDQGVSASHAYLNRNKRSLALDLKQAEAVAIVRQLVADYDIVLEQFRPGVMERLGLGYEALKAINPKLIYVSITGYGQTGPYKDRAGHDINYLALAGIASYTGRQDSGPLPLGVQLADVGGGSLHAVIGLLAAVIARQHSGVGQYLDVSMTDCAFRRWLSVGSLEPAFMQQLCTALGRPELAAMGLSPKPQQQKALKLALQVEFEKRSFDELCELFAGIDACVEPVLNLSEAVEHPQLK
eukprot:gene20046-23833_t